MVDMNAKIKKAYQVTIWSLLCGIDIITQSGYQGIVTKHSSNAVLVNI